MICSFNLLMKSVITFVSRYTYITTKNFFLNFHISEMGIQEDDPYGLNFIQEQQDQALTFQDIIVLVLYKFQDLKNQEHPQVPTRILHPWWDI